MAVSYKRLWKLLVDKKMSKSDLRKKAEIAPNTMTKLRRDEEVSLTILSKICKTLHADFGDIVEYVPDAEIWDLYNENRELLGKDHVRGEQLPIDRYHLVVHVWIRNSMVFEERISLDKNRTSIIKLCDDYANCFYKTADTEEKAYKIIIRYIDELIEKSKEERIAFKEYN